MTTHLGPPRDDARAGPRPGGGYAAGRDDLDDPLSRELRTVGHVSYLLHALVALGTVVPGLEVGVLLLVAALILDWLRKDAAAGTWQASHFRWRLRSVLWAGGLYAATAPLFLLFYFPGKLAWFLVSLWFLYRILRGWRDLGAGRAVGPPPPSAP